MRQDGEGEKTSDRDMVTQVRYERIDSKSEAWKEMSENENDFPDLSNEHGVHSPLVTFSIPFKFLTSPLVVEFTRLTSINPA